MDINETGNTEQVVDSTTNSGELCTALTKAGTSCKNKRKLGDLCTVHSKSVDSSNSSGSPSQTKVTRTNDGPSKVTRSKSTVTKTTVKPTTKTTAKPTKATSTKTTGVKKEVTRKPVSKIPESTKYVFFCKLNQKNAYLSNWFKAPIYMDGVDYPTVEHYMMYKKAMMMNDEETAKKILEAEKPSEVKALGKKVQNFDQELWDKQKFEIVYEANLAKYKQNPELQEKLLATGDKIIAEAADYDPIWGIGLSCDNPDLLDESKWTGQNLLGQVLMQVRTALRDSV